MTGREFESELPSPQREFVACLRGFAGREGEAARPALLRGAAMESARAELLADTEYGRWSDILNVQLMGLLAWCRALDGGDREELRFAADWLEMTFRCAPGLLPEPLRSARREQFTVDGLSALADDHGEALDQAARFVREGLGWGGVWQEVADHIRSRKLLRADPPDYAASADLARRVTARVPGGHWLGLVARVRVARSLGGVAIAAGRISSEEVLRAAEEAVAVIPEGHPWEAQVLLILQMHLNGAVLQEGLVSATPGLRPPPFDICLRAVEAGRRALAVVEDDDTDHLLMLHTQTASLGQLLLARPEDPVIRDELRRHSRLEVAQQHDAVGRSSTWLQLATHMFVLFVHTGDAYFFSEQATAAENAYRCAPPGSVEHARAARALGKVKTMVASRSPDPAAFDEPVDFYRSVIEGVGRPVATDPTEDAAERAITLADARGSLKEVLEARYQRIGEGDSRLDVLFTANAADASAPAPRAVLAAEDVTGRANRRHWITAAFWEATTSLFSKTEQALEDRNPAAVRAACGEFLARVDELAALAPDDRQIQESVAGHRRTAQSTEARARALETGEEPPLEELIALGRQHRDWIAPRLGTPASPAGPLRLEEGEQDRFQRLSVHQLKDHEVAKALELVARTEVLQAVNTEGEESADAWARAQETSRQLTGLPAVSPLTLVLHAGIMAGAAGDLDDWPAAAPALATAVRAAGELVSPRTAPGDRERMLALYTGGLADQACAAALLAGTGPEEALVLLESARGLLSAARLGSMSDLGTLRRAFPASADRFEAASAELEAARNDSVRRRRAAARWESEREHIRGLPGFEDFLGLPTGPRLRELAGAGPLVAVTLHQRRSHALLVTPDGVDAVPLPGVSREQAGDWVSRLTEATAEAVRHVLTELWQGLAGPVLDALGHPAPPASPDDRPRLWWIPSGPAAFLPLHAAGRFAGDVPVAGESALDRVVSSYAPTLRSLRHARLRTAPDGPPSVLSVAAPGATGHPRRLRAAVEEAEDVQEIVRAGHVLLADEARKEDVLAALPGHPWLHFAGHAIAAPDGGRATAAGGLVLGDGKLLSPETVDGLSLPDAGLAFLSGCGTARGATALADESLHVTAALHLAGYRDVIGTLWPVRDAAASALARAFYQQLIPKGTTPARAPGPAHALDSAVRAARSAAPGRPELWASHQHVGP
ncbi:CHAT domain-containing protein [Streptomyces sp. NPDC037389]|uniref:CHAT domain-containing protein n=1 Tax=Streptomyces sp. NPDC037389 TaxID=3155369 RepID=UPI0033D6CA6E